MEIRPPVSKGEYRRGVAKSDVGEAYKLKDVED
jgi:hypothetical protein